MGTNVYHIIQPTDDQIISIFKNFVKESGQFNKPFIRVDLTNTEQQLKKIPLEEIDTNVTLKPILELKSTLIPKISLQSETPKRFSIALERKGDYAEVTINLSPEINSDDAVPILVAVHKHLPALAKTETIDKIMGKEMSEFYRRREETLLKLEKSTQDVIQQNVEHRRQLDEESAQAKAKLQTDFTEKEDQLKQDFSKKEDKLNADKVELEKRQADLDDRDNRHARREKQREMTQKFIDRSKEFKLTEGTTRKRIIIHAIYIALAGTSGLLVCSALYLLIYWGDKFSGWYLAVRFSVSAASLIAVLIFYIRWNDLWFRQHANEEFRLKRLEMDMDRAGWVMEMALEWQDEKGGEIPDAVIDRLSHNLFAESPAAGSKKAKHPSEDLLSFLLRASKIKLKAGDFGEVEFDQKAVKKLKKPPNQE